MHGHKPLLILVSVILAPFAGAQITEIIDVTGEDENTLNDPQGIAVDGSGNVYIAGEVSDNAFAIETPDTCSTDGTSCPITEIIDELGDRDGAILDGSYGIAVDGRGIVYVTGLISDNVFKITPTGAVTEIINASGDRAGNPLDDCRSVAVDDSGNVFVTGINSSNAFKITPGGVISEIIDMTGDKTGNELSGTHGVAVDAAGNVYVAGAFSDNAFKITPSGSISEIIDASGDGYGNELITPRSIDADDFGNVYVAGVGSSNVFKIEPGGLITEIINSMGDGEGNPLIGARDLAVDAAGNVYVVGQGSNNAFVVTPGGVIKEFIDATGDGRGNILDLPQGIAVDETGNVFVTGTFSDNAFRIEVTEPPGFNKSFHPDTVVSGAVSRLTFTINNIANPGVVNELHFDDFFPVNLGISSPSNVTTTCIGGTITAIPETGGISYNDGAVFANSKCTIGVDVTSDVEDVYVNTTGDLTSSAGNSGVATAILVVDTFAVIFSDGFESGDFSAWSKLVP